MLHFSIFVYFFGRKRSAVFVFIVDRELINSFSVGFYFITSPLDNSRVTYFRGSSSGRQGAWPPLKIIPPFGPQWSSR